ncbi:MAG: hypothetical protein EOP43_02745 [Sphingobacteriaceae bacterium]|nr:MAG: hypothetical protein EOP43_02745 [Sphingobacteriaceae bacterium]
MDRLRSSGLILFIAPPLLFGTAFIMSNWNYLKNHYSLAIPIIFLFVYTYGTLPVYDLGRELFKNIFIAKVLGCTSAFLLVTVVIKLFVNSIRIGLPQVALFLCFPFFCISVEAFIRGQLGLELHSYLFDRLDITVLIYQLFLSIYITSILGTTEINC